MEPIRGANRYDILFYVEKGNSIRLIKEIKLSRFKKLKYFKDIEKEISILSKTKEKSIFSKINDLSELKFYFLIEGKHLFDKDEYFKDFFKKPIDKEEFKKKHEEILKSIENKKNKPKDFYPLEGIEFKGCYLLVTNKTDMAKINPFSSNLSYSHKIDKLGRYPKEIKEMCEEYNTYISESSILEMEELKKFMSLPKEDKSSLIENILNGIVGFKKNESAEKSYDYVKSKVRIEDVLENKISDIDDTKLLNTMMESAINKENYELCSVIRDRIKEIEEKK